MSMDKNSVSSSETEMRYIQAVNAALKWSLENIPESVIFGEDVAIPGGPFGSSKGLHSTFGEKRIFDTPISEQGFLGLALGAAITGLRPIVEIMYIDFAFVAMDQIVNQIATTRYSSNGTMQAPIVIRTQQGYSPGACAQHSHSAEAYFAHTPGLRIAIPSSPSDAYQLLRTAVLRDDPVIVIESRQLYPKLGLVNLDAPVEKMGGARVVRQGVDVTIISWGTTVQLSLDAAEILSSEGVDAEVIDLRWLSPLDMDSVNKSVQKTGYAVVAHEANVIGGFGAEIVARLADDLFDSVRGPIKRVGAPNVHMPAAPALQKAVVPNASDIVVAVRSAKRIFNHDA